MEMIFVLCENKPPFIGLVFKYEVEARKFNKDWLEDYGNFEWAARLEKAENKLTLTVWALRTKFKHSYEIDTFSKQGFDFYIKECQEASHIN